MSSRPMDQGNYRGAPMPPQPEPSSVIDQYSSFDGTYNSSRDLRVEGQVKGTIVCKGALHVAQGASVKASVEAESISVAGELDGEITCRGRLELLPSGRMKGQIATQSLVIHEGASYEGEMLMGSNALRRRRPSAPERHEAPATAPAAAEEITTQAVEVPAPAPEVAASEAEAPSVRANSFIRRFGAPETPAVATSEENGK
ncbi:MAG: polymer-forming cytoskeletal protein [Thermomicrobiales bacterium]|nr:polymer-forming cytoskeletal protein [Thermomicrobiales bacterium]